MTPSRYANYDVVIDYSKLIITGRIIANKERIQAAQRFERMLADPRYDFRPRTAEMVIGIIERTFVHIKGPLKGQPFLLIPWEKFVVYNLAGFYHKGTEERVFKEAFIFVPRKNGKTPFAAALAWGFGLLQRKEGTTCYLVGAALQQAKESFNMLARNIRQLGKEEKDAWTIHDSQNDHSLSRTWSDASGKELAFLNFIALASNPDAQDSFNCNLAICDELHAYKKTKQYTLFKQAQKAYVNKLLIGITTAGDDTTLFCYYRLQYCRKVLAGTVEDEQYFIFICCADNPEDYTNPVEHEKANPSYGVTIRPQDILETSLQAQNDPKVRADFISKELNCYVHNQKTYFDMDKVRSSDEKYSYTLEQLAKMPIDWYGGADLSKIHDLSGASIHGIYGDLHISITHGFMPTVEAYKKADEDNIPFMWWEEQGWLTLCNSETINYDDVVRWFILMRDKGFKIKWVGYDRRYSREFITLMKAAHFKVVDQAQRYVEKTEAFRAVEGAITKQAFYYMHSAAFEYCIGNVYAVEDSDEFVRYKKVNDTMRIDLFDADVIATKQCLVGAEKRHKQSSWFDEGDSQ